MRRHRDSTSHIRHMRPSPFILWTICSLLLRSSPASTFTLPRHPFSRVATTRVRLASSVPPDFTGKWELDLKSSEKMRPMLKACGMNSLLITVLERLGVKQDICATSGDETDYRLEVNITTAISSSSFVLSLDEAGVQVPGPLGGPTRAVSAWSTDAEALVTRQFVSADDDEAAAAGGVAGAAPGTRIFVTRRSLQDAGKSLFEDCTVEQVAEGMVPAIKLATCRRILRRRPS